MTYVLLLLWFALQFFAGALTGLTQRSTIILVAEVSVAVQAMLVVALLQERIRHPVHRLRRLTLPILLSLWIVLITWNAYLGILQGNAMQYVLGDFYRFGSMPVMIAIFCVAIRNRRDVAQILRGFTVVYLLFLTSDLVRFGRQALHGTRLTTDSTFYATVMAPIVIFLVLFDRRPLYRLLAVLGLLEISVAMLLAQMFTPLLSVVGAFALYLILTKRAAIAVGLGVAGLLAGFAVLEVGPAISPRLSYLQGKIQLAESAPNAAETLEALSGARLGEMIFVYDYMASAPRFIPLGAGLGGMVIPRPVGTILNLPISIQYKHYMHSGFNEIFYRTGAAGLLIMVLLLAVTARRGWNLYRRSRDEVGLLGAVGSISLLVLLSFACDLQLALVLLVISVAAVSAAETEAMQTLPAAWSEPASAALHPALNQV